MNDTSKAGRDAEMIAEDVEKRVSRWTKREICPFCDSKTWYVLTGSADGTHAGGAVISMSSAKFPAHTLFCANCGFVRQHLISIVDGQFRIAGSQS